MPLKYSPEGQIIGCRAESVPDAKLCIKALKLKKKDLQGQKKEVAAQIAQVRANHRSAKIQMGPAMRGSGFLANVSRTVQRTAKHSAAVSVDNTVRELESKKSVFDQGITQVDNAILQLERYVLENSPKPS